MLRETAILMLLKSDANKNSFELNSEVKLLTDIKVVGYGETGRM